MYAPLPAPVAVEPTVYIEPEPPAPAPVYVEPQVYTPPPPVVMMGYPEPPVPAPHYLPMRK